MRFSQSTSGASCGSCNSAPFCDAFRSASDGHPVDGPGQRFIGAGAGRQIVFRGQSTDDVSVLCAGWAFRCLPLRDGGRQILKFLLPGDILDPALVLKRVPEASVQALTAVQVVAFCRAQVEARGGDSGLARVITESLIEDGRSTDKLLAVVAQSSAEERIAYLFVHLMRRMATRFVIREDRYPFPLRQQHIADAVGLTAVHVSRVLGGFRDRRILTLAGRTLQVLDRNELEKMASMG